MHAPQYTVSRSLPINLYAVLVFYCVHWADGCFRYFGCLVASGAFVARASDALDRMLDVFSQDSQVMSDLLHLLNQLHLFIESFRGVRSEGLGVLWYISYWIGRYAFKWFKHRVLLTDVQSFCICGGCVWQWSISDGRWDILGLGCNSYGMLHWKRNYDKLYIASSCDHRPWWWW